jgi:hypothetical protein
VLAEFMVMWRWEYSPQTNSLRWTLEMTQVPLLLSNIYAAADLGEFHAKSWHQRKERCEETGSL